MDKARNYPIGIQDFEKIITGGYSYVDKTALIHRLVVRTNYCFLSRPRRFGKSLLLSTIKAYFGGRRDLFRGLAIDRLTDDWAEHAIFHLDLNAANYADDPDSLDKLIASTLHHWEERYGASTAEVADADRLTGVIRRAHELTGRRVVILVDEYDKPLLSTIGNEPLQERYRNTLKSLYGVLKSADAHIRFAMLTGVTKFGKVSVFSDLNNLNDISFADQYAALCGITEEELEQCFAPDIRLLAEQQGLSPEATLAKLKAMYDGYHFSPAMVDIYNPFSLLCAFDHLRFGNYWFSTGTPTFLIELIRQKGYSLQKLSAERAYSSDLQEVDSLANNPVTALYQTGYLTIKGYDAELDICTLGFPNGEVESSFLRCLVPYYTSVDSIETADEFACMLREIRAGDVDAFMRRLQRFLAGCPYGVTLERERHYQNVLFIVFRLLGFYTQIEYKTAVGRIDLLLTTEHLVYVMEMKLDGSTGDALQQIRKKDYAAQFVGTGKRILLVGVNFSNETRNIASWKVEEI